MDHLRLRLGTLGRLPLLPALRTDIVYLAKRGNMLCRGDGLWRWRRSTDNYGSTTGAVRCVAFRVATGAGGLFISTKQAKGGRTFCLPLRVTLCTCARAFLDVDGFANAVSGFYVPAFSHLFCHCTPATCALPPFLHCFSPPHAPPYCHRRHCHYPHAHTRTRCS
jgi:hypothetical protein